MLVCGLMVSALLFNQPVLEEAWFHVEGPEVTVEPFRDHGDGARMCSMTEEEQRGEPTFPNPEGV